MLNKKKYSNLSWILVVCALLLILLFLLLGWFTPSFSVDDLIEAEEESTCQEPYELNEISYQEFIAKKKNELVATNNSRINHKQNEINTINQNISELSKKIKLESPDNEENDKLNKEISDLSIKKNLLEKEIDELKRAKYMYLFEKFLKLQKILSQKDYLFVDRDLYLRSREIGDSYQKIISELSNSNTFDLDEKKIEQIEKDYSKLKNDLDELNSDYNLLIINQFKDKLLGKEKESEIQEYQQRQSYQQPQNYESQVASFFNSGEKYSLIKKIMNYGKSLFNDLANIFKFHRNNDISNFFS
ncbi:MAG: hypothetical protein Q8807_02350 ['Waltheria sp.' little leaf phytoplasma]|nr:hypothetical protein ['Waltheria sp.' little leaf phytoplasma]